MNPKTARYVLTLAVLGVLSLLVLSVAAPAAAMQADQNRTTPAEQLDDDNETTADNESTGPGIDTGPDNPGFSGEDGAEESDGEVVRQDADEIDREIQRQIGQLDVVDFRIEQRSDDWVGVAVVRWRGDSPETVSFSQFDRDSGSAAIGNRRVVPGELTRLEFDLITDQPVLLWTEESLQRDRAIVLSYSESTAEQTTLGKGVVIGLVTAISGTVAMAWRRKNSRTEPVRGFES